jgi:hypothetical protein
MNDSYDTYIETVTAFIGEYCDMERIQREDCSLTDDNWNRLDDLFFDKMKEAIEETIKPIVWNVLNECTSQLLEEEMN